VERIDEESWRAMLDARGILRPDAPLPTPTSAAAYTVFAQRPDARIDLPEWRAHAERFWETRVGLTLDKRYEPGSLPRVDAARVVVLAPANYGAEASGTRLAFGRPRTEGDAREAAEAERRAGGAGMSALARRCGTVWLVVAESETDRVALLLASILAGVLLGPILAPKGASLFGPKTARARLEAR
jgi:hypothetical protein